MLQSVSSSNALTNHEITIALEGGAVLGPFKATWSTDTPSDVRDLVKEYDRFLHGEKQTRFKYHLHDNDHRIAHTLIIRFEQITAIYDAVDIK